MDVEFRRNEGKDLSTDPPTVSNEQQHQQQCQLYNDASIAGHVLDVEAFIATVVDAVNDLTIEGLNSMEEFVAQELDLKSEEERHFLKQGVDSIYSKAQDNLDENLHRWENICRDRYFSSYPPKYLISSSSEKRTGSKTCSKASCVEDGHAEMLDTELRLLRSQLVDAHKESAKMRGELTALEKQLALRREVLSDAKSLEESFDPDLVEEALRSANLLKDSILKASNSQEKASCLQTQLPMARNRSAEQSLEERISAMKLPDDLQKGDPAIVSLLGC